MDWLITQLWSLVSALFTQIQEFGRTVADSVLLPLIAQIPGLDFSSVSDMFAAANYFFPADEAIAFGSIIFTVWFAVFTYRFIKSWIPSVSG